MLCGKWKRYKKPLVSIGSTSDVNKIPMREEYQNAMEGGTDLDKKDIKLHKVNKLAYEDLVMLSGFWISYE